METNEIGSVKTAFRILETIKNNSTVGVTELANELEMPKSTIFSHLNTLTNEGYLIAEDEQYKLGLPFLDLGHNSRTTSRLFDVAKPKIDELANMTGEVANLLVEENGDGVYLYISLGENAISFDTYPGLRVSLYSTALGKSILAHMPTERLDGYLNSTELIQLTEQTITDPSDLRTELRQIRETGYALDREERASGLRCVAVPIVVDDQCMGAISVAGPIVRMQEERFESELPQTVMHTASEIELNLRYP